MISHIACGVRTIRAPRRCVPNRPSESLLSSESGSRALSVSGTLGRIGPRCSVLLRDLLDHLSRLLLTEPGLVRSGRGLASLHACFPLSAKRRVAPSCLRSRGDLCTELWGTFSRTKCSRDLRSGRLTHRSSGVDIAARPSVGKIGKTITELLASSNPEALASVDLTVVPESFFKQNDLRFVPSIDNRSEHVEVVGPTRRVQRVTTMTCETLSKRSTCLPNVANSSVSWVNKSVDRARLLHESYSIRSDRWSAA